MSRKYTGEDLYNCYNFNIDKPARTLFFMPWNDSDTGLANEDSLKEWEVTDYSAQNIIKGLHILEQESKDPIIINWLSYGGDWNAGMGIHDYVKTCKSHITMRCFGRVRSMGTVILQACDERLLASNCEFMIHHGSAAFSTTHEQDFEKFNEELIKNREKMQEIYLEKIREKKPRYSKAKLEELITYDKYMTPTEAIELGFADKII